MSSNSELKYRMIFEHAPIGIVYFNKDGILTDCNNQFIEILGSSREKLLGINMLNLPDQKISSSVKRALSGEKGYYEGHYKSITSGKVTPTRVLFAPIEQQDSSIEGGIGLVEDISEQVELNRTLTKFRLGIDRSTSPIYITDQDGYIQYANPAFETHYGFTIDEVIGKTPRILKSGRQDSEFYETFWNSLISGESAEGEMVNQTKDGKNIPVHYSTNPIIDEHGEHIGFISIQNDISDRVEMENKIRKSLKEKNVMLAEIHHRVKNNLAIISGLLELEGMDKENAEITEFVKKSQTRIKSMAIVHEKLYDNNSLSEVNLKNYVEELAETIEMNWVSRDSNIQFKLLVDDLSINVNQAIPLSLIIHELTTNAVKHAFTSTRKGLVTISVQENDEEITLLVTDNGDSVSDDFDIEKSQNLGLSLVQILTRQLNGELSCTVENGLKYRLVFRKGEVKGPSSNWKDLPEI
ncbi:MAG: PAS domain S-box protein [Balneolaceae bacterium]